MKKSWFSILFIMAMLSVLSVGTAADILYPVVVGGRWGYVNKSGETVINPQFDRAGIFAEGLAPAKMGRWGFVDAAGKVVVNPQFDQADVFSEGLAAVRLGGGGPGPFDDPRPWSPWHGGGGRYGFVDHDGKYIINAQFDDAGDFSGGLAAVKMGHWGFIDKSGKMVINPQFDEAESFANGLARVKMDGRFGYVNASGKYIWNPTK